jgi:fumarate reductase iron-sulfur subunit
VGTDDGVFACVGFMACDAYCPKDLPLAAQLAYLPRKLTLAGIGRGGNGRRPTT